jgi:hypothetical protein
MIYHSLFHALMTCGIIFWGNSSYSTRVFRKQKKAIRLITVRGNREYCGNLFKELNILPLMSQYILSLLTFVSNNREQYFANSEIYNINTKHTSNLHLPTAQLNIYQKEFIIQVLRFSVVFHRTSKHTLLIQEHLKRQLNFYPQTRSTH